MNMKNNTCRRLLKWEVIRMGSYKRFPVEENSLFFVKVFSSRGAAVIGEVRHFFTRGTFKKF